MSVTISSTGDKHLYSHADVLVASKVTIEGFVKVDGVPVVDAVFDFSQCPAEQHALVLTVLRTINIQDCRG